MSALVQEPVREPEQAEERSEDVSSKGKATWIELHEGVFAYLANAETTAEKVAAYISGHPEMPDALAKFKSRLAHDTDPANPAGDHSDRIHRPRESSSGNA